MWGYYVRGTREQFSFNQNTLPTQMGRKTKKKKKKMKTSTNREVEIKYQNCSWIRWNVFGVAFLDLTMIGWIAHFTIVSFY